MYTSSVISDRRSLASSDSEKTFSAVISTNHIYLEDKAVNMILKITTMAMNAMVKAVAAEPYLNFRV